MHSTRPNKPNPHLRSKAARLHWRAIVAATIHYNYLDWRYHCPPHTARVGGWVGLCGRRGLGSTEGAQGHDFPATEGCCYLSMVEAIDCDSFKVGITTDKRRSAGLCEIECKFNWSARSLDPDWPILEHS